MDPQQKAERRRQGLEDSVDLSQDMTRVAKRAGRINTAPKNVFQDAAGRRVVGPTTAQIQAGRASPSFYANKERQSNIDPAKESGTFAQTRFDYNKTNAGKATMDDDGKITPTTKPEPVLEAGVGGGVRVKKPASDTPAPAPVTGTSVPLNAFDKPSANASNQTPSKPAQPTAPGSASAASGPVNSGLDRDFNKAMSQKEASNRVGLIDGKPAAQWFKEAANRQGRSNSAGRVQPDPKPVQATPPSPVASAAIAKSNKEIDAKYPALFGKPGATKPSTPAPAPAPTAKAPVVASQSPAATIGQAASKAVAPIAAKAANVFRSLKPTVEYQDLPSSKRDALVRAETSRPTVSALNPTQIAQGGKSSVADELPGIGAPATNPDAGTRIRNDKAAVQKMTAAGVFRNQTRKSNGGAYVNRVAQQAKIKLPIIDETKRKMKANELQADSPTMLTSRMNGGRVNPFKTHLNGYMKGGCTHKVKPMKEGGGMPENEVILAGEEGPELFFKRKDGSMFVTPTDVTKQIIDGIEMEPTAENKEAMHAAKKRTKLRPKMFGGPLKSKPLGGNTVVGMATNADGNLVPGQSDAMGPMDSTARLQQQGLATSPMTAQEYQNKLAAANAQTQMNAGLPMPSNPFRRPGAY